MRKNGFYFYLSHLSSLWFHFFFQSTYDLEHLALKLDVNFFSLPFDAVNIYLVTMISEYVCSCDNIILKKKENMQSLTMITRNDKEQHEIWTKTKEIILKLIQTQQEFLVKIISFLPSDISLINAVGWVVHMSCYFNIRLTAGLISGDIDATIKIHDGW